jgi:3-deoxy-D-manno-octulosonic-acid transferase
VNSNSILRRERAAIWPSIYNALWYPALPFALIAAGGRNRRNRRERLGESPPDLRADSAGLRVWVHAASVGEVEGVRPVMLRLREMMPTLDFVTTVMTTAGRDAARRRLPGSCQLAPLDHSSAVRGFLARVRPTLVLIAETELWPNFFLQSVGSGARVAIINGRLSERSMALYRLIQPLVAHALARADLILTQTPNDAARFRQLGAHKDRVMVTGNTKFELDGAAPPLRHPLAEFAGGQPILVAGSTAPGEERIVLGVYRELVKRFPDLALVLAPRHLGRLHEVEQEIHDAGCVHLRASRLIDCSESLSADLQPKVLLLDTMGELRSVYRRAAIAFVGGSMVNGRGGQNLAEPASAAVPVLFGPHYENHRQVGDALLAADAARVVHDRARFEQACARWLIDHAERIAAGNRAYSVVQQLAGGVARTVERLLTLLDPACCQAG